MVSAWATENHLVLGQVKVDEKSNEITAIPQLLKALEISGCIITIDAMGCKKSVAEEIVDQDAEYILALKDNQGNLFTDVMLLFDDLEESEYKAYAFDYYKTVDKGHGRIEIRECWTISDKTTLSCLRGSENWRKLSAVSRIRAQRWIGDKKSCEDRYHIASVTGVKKSAKRRTFTLGHRKRTTLDTGYDF